MHILLKYFQNVLNFLVIFKADKQTNAVKHYLLYFMEIRKYSCNICCIFWYFYSRRFRRQTL